MKGFQVNLILLSLIFQLTNCGNRKPVNVNQVETTNLKRFEDANVIATSWSKENILTCHTTSEPDNLHPTNGNSNPRSDIFQYTQRTLLYVDYSKPESIPGLVTSLPEVSSDKLIYTYTLRDNIFWDDGSKLTAADIVFTAKAYKCPLTNNPQVRLYWNNVKDVLIDPENNLCFTIVMKANNFQNISFLTSFPILEESFHDKEKVLSQYSFQQLDDAGFKADSFPDLRNWAGEFNNDSYGRDPNKLNGLGMYKVSKWETGQYIILQRKTNHWTAGSTDYHEWSMPEQIIFKLNKDESSLAMEFHSQKVDATVNLSVGNFINLSGESSFFENYNAAMLPTFGYTYLCFNLKPAEKRQPFFEEVNIRKALAYLTPVEDIIKLQYKQFSNHCKRIISNVSPLKKEFNADLTPIPFDLNKATELLNKSGWYDTDNDGILDKLIQGKKVSFTAELNYIATSSEWKDIALFIREHMAKAGINIVPVGMDLKLFIEKARAHDFDLMLGSWSVNGMEEDFTQLWHTSSWTNHGSNYSGFGNPYTDSLIDSLKLSMSESDRIRLSHALQKSIYENQPYVFLYSPLRRNVIHKRFGNQMIFAEKPGILYNTLQLLSIKRGITIDNAVTP